MTVPVVDAKLPMNAGIERYFRDNSSYSSSGQASLNSGLIFMMGRILNIVIQIGSTIVLARILGPHDFGIVGLALALVAFAPLIVDFGTADAVNQQNRITPAEVSNLFWFNMLIGAGFTTLFAVASPFLANLFGQPTLTGVALIVSLTFVMQALSVQHFSLMRRAMEFERIALIETVSNLISSVVAVGMALTGWGFWALAVKSVLNLALLAVGAWLSCRWVPTLPRASQSVSGIVRIGSGVTGFAVADSISASLDRIALGYFYGPAIVGHYQNAFLLYSNMIAVLLSSLHNVAVSGLSKVRDNLHELKRMWFVGLSLVSFVSALAFAVLAVIAHDFVVILLGAKWEAAGAILCILAFRGIAQSAERTLGWLHVVSGRTERWTKWGMVSAVSQVLALAVGLPFGAIGVAVSYAAVMYVLFVPALVYAGRPIGIGTKDVLAAAGPQVFGATVAAILGLMFKAYVMADAHMLVRLIACSLFCIACYLFIVVVLFRVRKPVELAAAAALGFMSKAKGRFVQ